MIAPAPRRRTAAEIIAFDRGYDFAEMSSCRYQSTRFSNPAVYVLDDDYYASPASGRMPAGYAGMTWMQVGEAYGRAIYRAEGGKG